MDDLERAAERIHDLKVIVGRLNKEASRVDGPAGAREVSKKVGPNGVPEEFTSVASDAIQSLLDALATVDRGVHDSVAGDPPEWWRNLRTILANKRAEYAASHPALVNAFDILDGHIDEESVTLGGLPFLVERLDQKIMPSGAGLDFRLAGGPNPNGISFSFDPQIDHEIDQPLRKLLSKVSVFPEDCVAFLRRALNEVRDAID